MNEINLSVSNLKKYYGVVKAVDGISFKVKKGTVFGMLGPNGAGKTTTIETIVGLVERDEGDINILGLDPDRDLKEIKTKIGVQLQSPALFPRLTVREIIDLFASFYPEPHETADVIEQVGLENKAGERVNALSGGQRHRLAVAIAMVSNGDIIFLDEPTTGLDPQARRQLWDVILNLKEAGVSVFLTTHYMEEAERLCDYLVIIDEGTIIAEGSPVELVNKYFQERAVEFNNPGFEENEIKILEKMNSVSRLNYSKENDLIVLYTKDIPGTISDLMDYAATSKKTVEDMVVRHATLEDVFLKLTGRGIRE